VCDEERSKVWPHQRVGVEGHVKHADVRTYCGPNVSSPKQSVRQEHGEVADGQVLDRHHLPTVVVHVPMDIYFLPSSHALTKRVVS
jgi:hypothetical protein